MSSLQTITLATKSYNVSAVSGSNSTRVLAAADMTDPLQVSSTLEIAHQSGKNNKPDRHLVKLNDAYIINDKLTHFQVHTVLTVPKGVTSVQKTTGIERMVEVLTDLLLSEAPSYQQSIINNELV